MAPIRTYLCDYCFHEFDEIVRSTDPDVYDHYRCRCGSMAQLLPSSPSTPRGNFGTTHRNVKGDKTSKINFTNDEPKSSSDSPFKNRRD